MIKLERFFNLAKEVNPLTESVMLEFDGTEYSAIINLPGKFGFIHVMSTSRTIAISQALAKLETTDE